MAGTTNFLVFNEANDSARTFNDSEYAEATQRLNGVTPGMAISRLHNKLYLQGTAMAKAMAEAITANGDDCMDNDIPAITASINKLIDDRAAAAAVFAEYTKTVNSPMFNKRDIITTSGTYTAPVTGWYKITAKGGGGGGGGSYYSVYSGYHSLTGGAGGGEGGTTIAFKHMTAGDTALVVIGAGGTGGGAGGVAAGADGGNSTVTIDGNTYTANGGGGGEGAVSSGTGGSGTIAGISGGAGQREISNSTGFSIMGGNGGGTGGGAAIYGVAGADAGSNTGGGGGGGGVTNTTTQKGGAGGDGYAWFEYFDSSLNP